MPAQVSPKPDRASALSAAIVRIAEFWSLSNAKLGVILGISAPTVSRLKRGTTELDPASKSFEAGQFLLRLFRSLDALLGSDDAAVKSWLATPNLDLGAKRKRATPALPARHTLPLRPQTRQSLPPR